MQIKPIEKSAQYPEALMADMRHYYKDLYHETLNHENWDQKFHELRYREEETIGKKVLDLLKNERVIPANGKILVVGAGTGAEVFAFHQNLSSCDVYGVEPYTPAFHILEAKAMFLGLPETRLKHCSSEEMPFKDNTFDLVVCFTVLEHVSDVAKTLIEMKRVASKGGTVYIHTPDYRYPEEQHYKKYVFPARWSKKLAALSLRLQHRDTGFFGTLNFFGKNDLNRILDREGFVYERRDKYLTLAVARNSLVLLCIWLYSTVFKIPRSQIIIIKK